MISQEALLEKLQADLTRERELSAQVLHAIADRYDVVVDQLATFFDRTVSTLDDEALDLVFSPLFTPTLRDRSQYADLLGAEALTPPELEGCISYLEHQALKTPLRSPLDPVFRFPLPEVSIRRYVERLHLDQPIDSEVYETIEAYVPSDARTLTLILARDAVWQAASRKETLIAFLRVFQRRKSFSEAKIIALTDFVRTYRPASFRDLDRQLDSLISSCEVDMAAAGGQSFHDEALREKYEGRDERDFMNVESAQVNYIRTMDMAKDLRADYLAIFDLMPDIVERMVLNR